MPAPKGNKNAVGNKGGRPRKEIDKRQFESLCKIQCTLAETCGVLDVDDKTLSKWCKEEYGLSFSGVADLKRDAGRASLRRMQFKAAEKGNTAMLIFLGKNYLGQSDKHDVSMDGKLEVTVKWG
jgi:hypothetical protein